jgi:hypothetical protein
LNILMGMEKEIMINENNKKRKVVCRFSKTRTAA